MAVELDDVDVKLRSAAGAGEPVRQGPAAAGAPPEAGPGQAALPASACRALRVGRPPAPPASPGAGPVTDPYASGTCRWWHRMEPSPELVAAEATGALGKPGVVVDLGCGLGSELGYLAGRGWHGIGVDLSVPALARARGRHPGVEFARAAGTSPPAPARPAAPPPGRHIRLRRRHQPARAGRLGRPAARPRLLPLPAGRVPRRLRRGGGPGAPAGWPAAAADVPDLGGRPQRPRRADDQRDVQCLAAGQHDTDGPGQRYTLDARDPRP